MVEIHCFTFNPFSQNTYVIFNEHKNAFIIDPGNYYEEEDEQLYGFIRTNNLTIKKVVQTHCHIDHVFGLNKVCATYNVKPTMHKNELVILQNSPQSAARFGVNFKVYEGEIDFIIEGEKIILNEDEFEIIYAPGHAPGHICLYNAKQKVLIAGDVLFYESIGRTDFPMCSHTDLIHNIKTKLFTLPNETIVYSGHGLTTSIGHEKEFNPFVS
jgi:hydroxyacylglutathione hydrolase